ncbi:MAG: Fe-S cluster assembly protein SufD [Acidobacteriota bacterium]|jgi:Fe-S cluster assembly protein SufD|nr:Fe-S cluster assembly protein SufD [Acidobacteriota bacterium]MDT5262885.1 Fe-S cluster assembly protein SufD [Acidobacteriota bacterium]MDT7779843.1 Fe-S cluster assembly protein SufD [Acidobacteriota bacterium]
MSQAIKEQSAYGEAFREFADGARACEPGWVARLREGAFERFEELGLPTTDEEDWKYTSVAPLARQTFKPANVESTKQADRTAVEHFVSAEAKGSHLVFINGHFSPTLSSLEAIPEGVVAADIGAALAGEHAEVLWEHLGRLSGEGSDAFSALNTAFIGGGAFLHVPAGVTVEAPVQLLFLTTADEVGRTAPGEAESAAFPRVLVVTGRDSRLDIIESYAALGDETYFTDAVVEVFVGEGARVTHYKVQDEGARAFHIASTRAEVTRSGSYDLTTVTLGAQLSRHNIEVLLASEGAECRVDGLYIVGTGQHTDTHSLIDHREPHCTSRQNYKGILDGKSRAVFNGRVFVREGAQKTDAEQSNKNLLLSTDARVDTKPQLEILNDDVKCSHGATVGQLEEEELFYLLSRGLHADLARNLLTYGFAEEIVGRVKFDSIRAQLDEAILNRLHARLEA